MDFALTEEQRMIYEYGGRLANRFDNKYWLEKARAHEFPAELWEQVADDGFVGIMVPEEYGGSGLGMMEMALLMEGLSDYGIPLLGLVVGPTMTMPHIAAHGTEKQKKDILPAACAGEIKLCFAITEPTAGSNSMAITTIAKPNGNRFSLSGTKTYITDADVSDFCVVVARTTPLAEAASKTDGFTIFIVDLRAKGVSIHPIPVAIPIPERQSTLYFDEVDVGPEDVIGEVGMGFSILFDSLNPERIVLGAMGCGVGRYALGRAAEYASERTVFGQPIGAHQGVQHPLAKAKTQIEMASLMMRKAAWAFDNSVPCGAESNMAKYAGAEAAIEAVDAALQAHGGSGFTEETGIYELYPIVRLMRTAPVNRELILSYIGEKVMGLPRSY